MTRPPGAGPPAPLPGTQGLTGRNQMRLIGWAIRARLYGAGSIWLAAAVIAITTISAWIARPLGTGVAVATAAAVVVFYLVGMIGFVAAVQLLSSARRQRRGWLVGYFTADASQLVHPNPEGYWVLSDHFARRRGQGLAAAFRRRVFGHLAAEADRHHAVIVMETHAGKLAHIYAQDMPGLHIVARRRTINGPTWTLRREPELL